MGASAEIARWASEKLSGVALTMPITFGTGSSAPRMILPRASHCLMDVHSLPDRDRACPRVRLAIGMVCCSLGHFRSESVYHGCSIISTI